MSQQTPSNKGKALHFIDVAIRKKKSQVAEERKIRDYILSFPVYQMGKLHLVDESASKKAPNKSSTGEENFRQTKDLFARWDFSLKQLNNIIEAQENILKAYEAIKEKIAQTEEGQEKGYVYSDLLNFARIGLNQDQLVEFF